MDFLDAGSQRFLQDLARTSARLERAERQVSSGKRIFAASDDPDRMGRLMELRSQASRLEQTAINLDRVKTEVDSGEQALQDAVKLFDRVRVLGVTGANNLQSAATRATLAGELGSILRRLGGLANMQVSGRYIFSGDTDQTAAYSMDLLQSPPWSSYQGAVSTREILDPIGVSFPVARDAQTIFDNADPTASVFQAVDNLRVALEANDDAAIQTANAALGKVSDHLNSVLAFYGNTQTQIAAAVNTTANLKLRTSAELAGLEDADMTASIVEMQQMKTQQEAALRARAAMPRTSLFDYLG